MASSLRFFGLGLLALIFQLVIAEGCLAKRHNHYTSGQKGGIAYMAQIPPTLRPSRRTASLEEDALAIHGEPGKKAALVSKGLANALLEASGPDKQSASFELGLPVIDDVPPIAILWGLNPAPRRQLKPRLGF